MPLTVLCFAFCFVSGELMGYLNFRTTILPFARHFFVPHFMNLKFSNISPSRKQNGNKLLFNTSSFFVYMVWNSI